VQFVISDWYSSMIMFKIQASRCQTAAPGSYYSNVPSICQDYAVAS
jgi:hypothetical protein